MEIVNSDQSGLLLNIIFFCVFVGCKQTSLLLFGMKIASLGVEIGTSKLNAGSNPN